MLKKITTLSMALLFPVIASAYTPKKEALLVGIEKYENGDRLPGIELDIKHMRELLESRGYHVKVLFNAEATYNNVVSNLKSYSHLSSNDNFIFYDSTHGTEVPDLNGDEGKLNLNDHYDEALVLYNLNNSRSNEEGLLIDDELDILLSNIPAKKMMIIDACHSGTSYKSFSRDAKTKSIVMSKNFKFKDKSKSNLPIVPAKNLISFGASRDNQLSIATSDGSLFTTAFVDTWKNNPEITFKEMRKKTEFYIKDACARSNDNVFLPHTPTLYVTSNSYVNRKMNKFLQVNIRIEPQRDLVEDYLDELMSTKAVGKLGLSSKTFYNKKEAITFNVDTYGKKGHLYILTVKNSENEIDVLYPNAYYQNKNETWRGNFSFPNAKTPFTFQASNKTKRLERTVVYTILSQQPIPELEKSRKMRKGKFQSIVKDFANQSSLKNSVKDIIIRRKNNQISIAKQVFSVGV